MGHGASGVKRMRFPGPAGIPLDWWRRFSLADLFVDVPGLGPNPRCRMATAALSGDTLAPGDARATGQ